ncbi:thiol-disulfide oxidoreductase DCC family protein [Wenxinia marina]|uniref:DUF393 domain-containing protein n=1 Tax=Wenxinia marina DSM 24838 TaxID=1123501 RepID=A0A0D0NLX2_9RHOB|nr:DCC1-like thiol-disulfide oxidoreductase family protein [Wenxinia marina]KIQ69275.1 hypothetical protein Wenmar_02346 [Wenxinia marina DSM 24838]GGL71743.1 hypothetical protein GCM10011392_27930 [Wenxinia marina]
MKSTSSSGVPEASLIVYDGECVFCQNYVRFVRLRETVGPIELIDARSGDHRVRAFQRQGYDLNEGMLFVHNGTVHHGADAVHKMALLSSSSGLANRMNQVVLSNGTLARLIYPVLKAGRRITLLARGRRQIAPPDEEG